MADISWITNFLFGTDGFLPHSFCIVNPRVIGLNAMGDLLTAIAYFAIPLCLFRYSFRTHFIAHSLAAWFALFILLCGVSHVMEIIVLYYPLYVLSGAIKVLTGIVSLITMVKLALLMPYVIGYMTKTPVAAGKDIRKALVLRRLITQLTEYADGLDVEIT